MSDFVEVQTADIVPIVNTVSEVNSLSSAREMGIYSSIKGDSFENRLATLAAVTDAQRLDENLNRPIALMNVIVQAITVNDTNDSDSMEARGTVEAIRTILVDSDGNAYASVSDGIFKAVKNLFAIMGQPDSWPEPIMIQAVERKSNSNGMRKYYTLIPA